MSLRCRLAPLVIPSPQALAVTGVPPHQYTRSRVPNLAQERGGHEQRSPARVYVIIRDGTPLGAQLCPFPGRTFRTRLGRMVARWRIAFSLFDSVNRRRLARSGGVSRPAARPAAGLAGLHPILQPQKDV